MIQIFIILDISLQPQLLFARVEDGHISAGSAYDLLVPEMINEYLNLTNMLSIYFVISMF